MIGKELKEKGITLIALVITVVILIILATVTLNVVLGEGGLIQRAQQAKELTEQAALEEQQGLNSLMSEMTNIMEEDQTPPEEKSEVEEAKESGTPFEDTTTITDDLDNPVTVPGGFNIAEDSGTKVEEGIVIEDSNDNQFVWIPVGEYNVSTTINSTGKLTNELSRRTFTESGSTPVNGDSEIEDFFYGEGNENSVAKDQIDAFKTSATTNKGFYIGRYEQGEGNVCKAGVEPYANLTREQAKTQAEAMYDGNEFVTSELISSYAWDTALNYICQTNEEGYLLAIITGDTYGNMGTNNRTKTGAYTVNEKISDKYSNIFDILGNCLEWTTEYSRDPYLGPNVLGVVRGGSYHLVSPAAYRNNDYHSGINDYYFSFRIQLYINPTISKYV